MTEPGYREQPKRFRRRKKHEGSTWTPPSQSAVVEDGAWCKACKSRHGYMSMGFRIDIHESGNTILWSCPKYGTVLEETKLGDNNTSS